jgi:hypothetical protein
MTGSTVSEPRHYALAPSEYIWISLEGSLIIFIYLWRAYVSNLGELTYPIDLFIQEATGQILHSLSSISITNNIKVSFLNSHCGFTFSLLSFPKNLSGKVALVFLGAQFMTSISKDI